jgi:crotonobetainyl-CoA:carnitine CoA-transferase CaiB-like acyl-CoA transferase
MSIEPNKTFLNGVRVLEIADERGEYVGRVLAGLGADVVKIEPPAGEATRKYGPFLGDDSDAGHSLYFWQYNLGKRGVVLDLDTEAGLKEFLKLARCADIVIDGRDSDYLEARGLGSERLRKENSRLIYAKVTPFGETGPWAKYSGSDLVHLALGGVMMNSGYDPDPSGRYDTPPIAPQMWHAYHIAGEHTVISILSALYWRFGSGRGQHLSTSVHHAVASNTESDVPSWVAQRTPYMRQTARHAMPALTMRTIAPTKDGRYIMPYTTYVKNWPSSWETDVATLRKYGMQEDLDEPQWEDENYRNSHVSHIAELMDRLIKRVRFDTGGLWEEMVAAGLTWAPVRRPEENLDDPHWIARGIFAEVEHPEVGQSFTYAVRRWVCDQADWSFSRRAPLLGEHNEEVRRDWKTDRVERLAYRRDAGDGVGVSKLGKPFALAGVRVVDLSWMLASAGGGRFLASMGADVIKVEHKSRIDGMRFAGITYPAGGRAARDAATGPLPREMKADLDQSASFNEINPGKRAISLNLSSPRGKQILEQLIRDADVVVEGFSPGTMERMGLGYERLKELNPRIVYVQQSGFGQRGTYGRARAFGPTAQAFSGITDMSGMPSPWPPAGFGYSYLDWFGAYNMATAVLAGLHRLSATGEGCYIDTSQGEVGIYLTGTALLDARANERSWERYGNRSPYKPAAPSGAYPCAGADRWIALSAFNQDQWEAVIEVLGLDNLQADPRFATLAARLRHQNDLDAAIARATVDRDAFDLMQRLQLRGVPAGVAQTAQDRIEQDPQLRALGWQAELKQSRHGLWPAKTHPVTHSETPAYVGGPVDRHGPNYGEDTDDVLREILGFDGAQIAALREEGVL